MLKLQEIPNQKALRKQEQQKHKMFLTRRCWGTTTSLKSLLIATLFVCCCLMGNNDGVEAAKLRRNKVTTTTAATPVSTDLTKNAAANASQTETVAATAAETNFAEAAAENTNDDDDEKQTVAIVQQPQPQTPAAANVDSDDATLSVWGIVRSVWNWIRTDLSESLLGDDDDENATAVAAGGVGASGNGNAATTATTSSAVEGRTFGKIRRLQMALIPIIFKFGVLSAMVAFLVMLGMKTLFLLKVLIVMNAAALLGKFLTLKTNFGGFEHHHVAPPPSHPATWSYNNWNPHQANNNAWSASAPAASHASPPSKEIHLHIHGAQTQPQVSAYSSYGVPAHNGGGGSSGGWERRNDPYSAYDMGPINAISEVDIENELNNQGPIAALPTKYPANHRY